MGTVLFAVSTVICAFGWLNCYVSRMAILYYYMKKKQQDKPEATEMNECFKEAWLHLFNNGKSNKA